MGRRGEIAKQFIEAQRGGDVAAIDALAASLTEDATFVNARMTVSGRDQILRQLKTPFQGPGAGAVLGMIRWGRPHEDGRIVTVSATLPPNPTLSGVAMVFRFNDQDQLERIETVPQRG